LRTTHPIGALACAWRTRRARAQGAFWVEKLQRGLADSERRAFESYIADPSSAREFHELRAILDVAAELDAGARTDLLQSIAETNPRPQSRLRHARRWIPALAAALVMLVMAGWLALRGAGYLPETYRTATGQSRAVVLPDGSLADLNTRTELEWIGSPSDRRVRLLRGEALFEVVHEPLRPFRIVLAHSEVQVLGTRFDVYQKTDGNVVVTVVSGTVSVEGLINGSNARPCWTRRLTADEQIEYSPVGLVNDVHATVAPDAIRWREGMVETRGEPLSKFVSDLSRYTAERIVIVDPRAASVQIGGAFSVRDVDATLERIAEIAPVTVTREHGEVILGYRAPSGAAGRAVAGPH
jgi:transmembrane sensor